MKSENTYVDASKFEAILRASGLPFVNQKGFVRVDGPRGRRLYVANTKRVGRVDISGFVLPDDTGLVRSPHDGERGNVRQQLDFRNVEEDILMAFAVVLAHLAHLEPAAEAVRRKAAPAADAPVGWSPEALGSRGDRADRRDRIARLSARG